MRATLRILALAASFAALIVIGGGHWAALQTAAWARMIVSYTHDAGSLGKGFARTFDGAHPCQLCRQISAGMAQERHDERQKSGQAERVAKASLTTVLPAPFSARFVRHAEALITMVNLMGGRLSDAPPVPPPRLA